MLSLPAVRRGRRAGPYRAPAIMRQDPEDQAEGMGRAEGGPIVDITALGGPHDGDVMAVDSKIRSIQFMIMPERRFDFLSEAELEVRVDFDTVTYQVVRWYTGHSDTGEPGRMLMVVLAPDHWPKAGTGKPLYPPWTP